jgi:hypothetical protein
VEIIAILSPPTIAANISTQKRQPRRADFSGLTNAVT